MHIMNNPVPGSRMIFTGRWRAVLSHKNDIIILLFIQPGNMSLSALRALSGEVLRLASRADELEVKLRSVEDIQVHIHHHASHSFKRDIHLAFERVKLDETHVEAVRDLVREGFSIVSFTYDTPLNTPVEDVTNRILQTSCAYDGRRESLAVAMRGKKPKRPMRIFEGVDVSNITSLDLSSRKALPFIADVASTFKSCSRLTELCLQGVMFDHYGVIALKSWLVESDCSIQTLDISFCGLSATDLIQRIVEGSRSLTSLNISTNALMFDQISDILEKCAVNKVLKSLDLSNNVLSGLEGELASSMLASDIDTLNVANCRIQIRDFAAALNSTPDIQPGDMKIFKRLNISYNPSYGVDAAVLACAQCFSHVISLDLEHTLSLDRVTYAAWKQFCDLLASSSVVQELSLRFCGLSGPQLWVLRDSLREGMVSNLSTDLPTTDAMKSSPWYGYLTMMLNFLERQSDLAAVQNRFNFFIQAAQQYVEYTGREDLAVEFLNIVTLLRAGQYEPLLELIKNTDINTPCLWQRFPGMPSPFSAPALEVLHLGDNVRLGFSGAVAMSDFFLVCMVCIELIIFILILC